LIAVATFKRPEGLRALLTSITPILEGPHRVVVVDNDPAGSARAVAEDFGDDVSYVVEQVAGIASARNRAFAFTAGMDAIVFVDDDEFAAPGWLKALAERARESSAGVVMGPVISVFPSDAPRWVTRGGFIQRELWPDGTKLSAGATNNTLLKLSAWTSAGAPRFDTTFSTTGGSDAHFFARLIARGVEIEYCESAKVYEPVPAERMTFKWLSRRAYRNGIVLARIWAPKHGRFLTLGRGVLLFGTGFARGIVAVVTSRKLESRAFNEVLGGLGVVSALAGIRVHEYKRASRAG
jgi:glycosyltransferase involved in cell wall biosynthesis